MRDYLSSQELWGLVSGDEKAPAMPMVAGTTGTTETKDDESKTTWKKMPTSIPECPMKSMPYTYSGGIAMS